MLIGYGYVWLILSGSICFLLFISDAYTNKQMLCVMAWSFIVFLINFAGIVYYTYSDKEVIYKNVNVITKGTNQYADINDDGKLICIRNSNHDYWYKSKVKLKSYKFQRYGIFYPEPGIWE